MINYLLMFLDPDTDSLAGFEKMKRVIIRDRSGQAAILGPTKIKQRLNTLHLKLN